MCLFSTPGFDPGISGGRSVAGHARDVQETWGVVRSASWQPALNDTHRPADTCPISALGIFLAPFAEHLLIRELHPYLTTPASPDHDALVQWRDVVEELEGEKPENVHRNNVGHRQGLSTSKCSAVYEAPDYLPAATSIPGFPGFASATWSRILPSAPLEL